MICVLISLLVSQLALDARFPEAAQLPVMNEMPDPLVALDGTPVQTVDAWKERREEIQDMLLHYEYGHAPAPPDNLRVEGLSSEPVFNGAATLERFTLIMGPKDGVHLEAAVYVPAGERKKPVLLAIEPVWDDNLTAAALQAVQRDYIFAGYRKQDLDPDDEDRTNGVHPLYPDYDWATLAVWAWGASRVVDYLYTRADVNTGQIALTGHSRAGKSAMLASALDERITLVAPHGSGAGGAGSFRQCPQGAESLGMITLPTRFHYWFQPRLHDFAKQEDRLPFDQHFLRALIAPRIIVSMDGLEDYWANPSGTKLMWTAAQPVFNLLNVPDHNVLHFRPGGHDYIDEDWTVLLDYCDHFFFGKPRPADTSK